MRKIMTPSEIREYSERMSKIKKIIFITITIISVIALLIFQFNLSSCQRAIVDIKSDVSGGLDRTINVYTADGNLLATYTGKIDLEQEASYIKFDFNGKRYIYYNCFVETIADIN